MHSTNWTYESLGRWRKIYVWYLWVCAGIIALLGLFLAISGFGEIAGAQILIILGWAGLSVLAIYLSVQAIIKRRTGRLVLLGLLFIYTPNLFFHLMAAAASSRDRKRVEGIEVNDVESAD